MLAKVPKSIVVVECSKCGMVRLKNHWAENDPRKIIEGQVKFSKGVSFWDAEPTDKKVLISVVGEEEGLEKEEKHAARWEVKRTVCRACSRIAGGYHEAVIQLRGGISGAILEQVYLMFREMQKKNKMAFYREEPVKGGVDLVVGDKNSAKRVVGFLRAKGAEIKESFKLVGRKEGRPVKRMTYSARFKKPEIVPNV